MLVNVDTRGWGYWEGQGTDHVVVVTGIDIDEGVIYVNDPFFSDAPQEVPLIEFETGWEEKRRQYAVISLEAIK